MGASRPVQRRAVLIGRRILRLPFMICYAITMHLIYGILLLGWDIPGGIAIVGGFGWAVEYWGSDGAGAFLVCIALLALVAVLLETEARRLFTTLLLLPQYGVLLYAFYEGMHALAFGLEVQSMTGPTAGEMVTVPTVTVISALHPIWGAAVWHTLAFASRIVNTAGDSREVYLERRLYEETERRIHAEAAVSALRRLS